MKGEAPTEPAQTVELGRKLRLHRPRQVMGIQRGLAHNSLVLNLSLRFDVAESVD